VIKFRPPRVEGSPLEAQAEASTAKVIGTQEAFRRLGFMDNSGLRAVAGNVALYQAWEPIVPSRKSDPSFGSQRSHEQRQSGPQSVRRRPPVRI